MAEWKSGGGRMTREQREQAARTLQEFYDFNKTLTPQGDSWLQADITINRYTQRCDYCGKYTKDSDLSTEWVGDKYLMCSKCKEKHT